jgi:hypothetical protein
VAKEAIADFATAAALPAVQLTGPDLLKEQGITLLPVDAPDYFINETPTAVFVRQVLGAVSQFEKASLVEKLRQARDRRCCRAELCSVPSHYT